MQYFGAIVDGDFITNDPKVLLMNSAVPYMIGFNSSEGHGILAMRTPPGMKDGLSLHVCKETLKAQFLLMGFKISVRLLERDVVILVAAH